MKSRILAVVVTYYPEKDLLIQNINAFRENVDKVLVWENTPQDKRLDYRFLSGDGFMYCGDGINSISHALNFAWHFAKEHGYDYLLTMDQDSCFEDFNYYLNQTIYNPSAPSGIYGPCINGESHQEDFYHQELITSGMLVSIDILDVIGGYNEQFRVDGIDTWLCCTAQQKGINSYTVKGAVLRQRFGSTCCVKILWRQVNTVNYPPSRLYGIFKTKVILLKQFELSSGFKKYFYKTMLIDWVLKILFLEEDKSKKLLAILRGIKDGLKYRSDNGE